MVKLSIKESYESKRMNKKSDKELEKELQGQTIRKKKKRWRERAKKIQAAKTRTK